MAEPTFYWHDYETFGTDPRRDRPAQFAGIRTDANLEIVGEPLMIYCKPPRDVLPQPVASLVTGIAPQLAEREGLREADFAAAIHDEIARPGTCTVGYNSLRFDDEFTRHLLYRNFYDPYGREWENGNSRWDLIDLVRMCQALRPEGIVWPTRDDGTGLPSFKLEHLARANGLKQERAHDALSDVEALIGLARLIRQQQPRLWDWYFALRRKQRVFELLDVAAMTPVVHVSSRYPASRQCLTVIAPLAAHPSRQGEIIVYDLTANPADLLALDDGDIADRVFTSRADLPEGVERIALRTIRANHAPALAPMSVLKDADLGRLGLDMEAVDRHLASLREASGLAEKLRRVYGHAAEMPTAEDPELGLYGAFLPNADRGLLAEVRGTPPEQLGSRSFPFRDTRYPELLFRYRARNWPETLDAEEHARWEAFRLDRLTRHGPLATLTFDDFAAELATLRALPDAPYALLDELDAWATQLR